VGKGIAYMNKIVVMHQPNYLPWIGLFSRVMHSDCFVMVDTMPFTKRSLTHRNKIKTNSGWHYLTVPISTSFELAKICDVTLPEDNTWQQAHWKLISDSYAKTDFFEPHRDFFQALYQKNYKFLWQINEEIILYLFKCFKINVDIVKASKMNIVDSLQKTDLMIALLKNVDANVYLSGPSGSDYLEVEKFSQNKIDLKYFKFQHPNYRQRFVGFEPNMSAIDLLFNMGPQASEIIRASGSIS
jgi:hypothetical protein